VGRSHRIDRIGEFHVAQGSPETKPPQKKRPSLMFAEMEGDTLRRFFSILTYRRKKPDKQA
jgi:hypothetical protein